MKRTQPTARHTDIPPDREDGKSSLVHRALIYTGRLGTIRPSVLLPLWAILVVLGSWPWRPLAAFAASAVAILLAIDWVMLASLPRGGRSWGPVTPPLLGLSLTHVMLFWIGRGLAPGALGLSITITANVLVSAAAVYATWIEPFQIRITEEVFTVAGPETRATTSALHVSDIHYEGESPRERRLLDIIGDRRPDLLLLTGDYLNLSSVYEPAAQEGVRRLLECFQARLGIYAVTGSPPVDVSEVVPRIFGGLPIHWLDDQAVSVDVGGHAIWLLGVRHTYDEARDIRALEGLVASTPPSAMRILLYHTPDLMPVAASLGIDLYLCGHTHGGQISLPLYGALATSSRWGKRYEQGRYQEGRTTLYVSRGLGLEGLGAPRARFMAPPEVIWWQFKLPPSKGPIST